MGRLHISVYIAKWFISWFGTSLSGGHSLLLFWAEYGRRDAARQLRERLCKRQRAGKATSGGRPTSSSRLQRSRGRSRSPSQLHVALQHLPCSVNRLRQSCEINRKEIMSENTWARRSSDEKVPFRRRSNACFSLFVFPC